MKIHLLVLVFLMVLSSTCLGHPPGKIDVVVDDGQVQISVFHPVDDPGRHYVRKIEIFVNGEQVLTPTFSSQKGNRQEATFSMPLLKRGDVLEIIAYCNISGKLNKKVIVER